MKKFYQKHKRALVFLIVGFVFFATILPIVVIKIKTSNKIYALEDAPAKKVAIVFGAAIIRNSYPSTVLADRVATAVELYQAGKVEKILMSGDNSTFDHDEPTVMKNHAISLGVKAEDIALDYAGFRTYDTCARANKIFQIDSALLVSQESHLPRAILLCEYFGIRSAGVIADKREYRGWTRQKIREFGGKVLTFYEIYFFPHEPKFLGPLEEI